VIIQWISSQSLFRIDCDGEGAKDSVRYFVKDID